METFISQFTACLISVALLSHLSKAPKSGKNMMFRPFSTFAFSIVSPFKLPAANQINSGRMALAMRADFSLSTIATSLSG